MKVFQCDSCKKIIENPYTTKMKEFCVGTDFDNGMFFPVDVSIKTKIHLCDECFKGLQFIATKKRSE